MLLQLAFDPSLDLSDVPVLRRKHIDILEAEEASYANTPVRPFTLSAE